MTVVQADIDNLATFVTANEHNQRLIELTQYDDPDAIIIETTFLKAKCLEAIHWFQLEFKTFNSDIADLSNPDMFVARIKTMQLLYEATDDRETAKEYEDQLVPLMQKKRTSRTLAPTTSSQIEPSSRQTGKSAFDDDQFEGFVPDIAGGSRDF